MTQILFYLGRPFWRLLETFSFSLLFSYREESIILTIREEFSLILSDFVFITTIIMISSWRSIVAVQLTMPNGYALSARYSGPLLFRSQYMLLRCCHLCPIVFLEGYLGPRGFLSFLRENLWNQGTRRSMKMLTSVVPLSDTE